MHSQTCNLDILNLLNHLINTKRRSPSPQRHPRLILCHCSRMYFPIRMSHIKWEIPKKCHCRSGDLYVLSYNAKFIPLTYSFIQGLITISLSTPSSAAAVRQATGGVLLLRPPRPSSATASSSPSPPKSQSLQSPSASSSLRFPHPRTRRSGRPRRRWRCR